MRHCSQFTSHGEEVNRLLHIKSCINRGEVTIIPRAELQGAHLCSRLYSLLQDQLRDFLATYGVKISFKILSDSEIVLNQIEALPYQFTSWVGSRIQEIRENIDEKVVFEHTPSY